MLHLLEGNNIEIVDSYLLLLRKYIGSSVKIEEQIKGRKAIWLEEVKIYLRIKLELEQQAESFIEDRIVEIQNDQIIVNKTYVPWRIYDLETYNKNLRTLLDWKQKLTRKYKSIEGCYN